MKISCDSASQQELWKRKNRRQEAVVDARRWRQRNNLECDC
jgi:hypothetical protein